MSAAHTTWSGQACRARPTLRLRSVRTDGSPVDLTVRPTLRIFIQALRATEPAREENPVAWTLARAELGSLVGDPVPPGEWVARRPLEVDEVLTTELVRPPWVARSGSTVEVVLRRGPIVLKDQGTLLVDAANLGQSVRVATSRAAFDGVLVDPDTVEIQ